MQIQSQIEKATILAENAKKALLEFEKYAQTDKVSSIILDKKQNQLTADEKVLFDIVFDTFDEIKDLCTAWD